MSLIGVALNLLLVVLLGAALTMGWRLNRRLKALRESHDGFAVAVRELNEAAVRAERGLAELRAATDETADFLADRVEKGRALAVKLEKLLAESAHAVAARPARVVLEEAPLTLGEPVGEREKRLGALLAAAREPRARQAPADRREAVAARLRASFDDDLFEEPQTRLGPLGTPRR